MFISKTKLNPAPQYITYPYDYNYTLEKDDYRDIYAEYVPEPNTEFIITPEIQDRMDWLELFTIDGPFYFLGKARTTEDKQIFRTVQTWFPTIYDKIINQGTVSYLGIREARKKEINGYVNNLFDTKTGILRHILSTQNTLKEQEDVIDLTEFDPSLGSMKLNPDNSERMNLQIILSDIVNYQNYWKLITQYVAYKGNGKDIDSKKSIVLEEQYGAAEDYQDLQQVMTWLMDIGLNEFKPLWNKVEGKTRSDQSVAAILLELVTQVSHLNILLMVYQLQAKHKVTLDPESVKEHIDVMETSQSIKSTKIKPFQNFIGYLVDVVIHQLYDSLVLNPDIIDTCKIVLPAGEYGTVNNPSNTLYDLFRETEALKKASAIRTKKSWGLASRSGLSSGFFEQLSTDEGVTYETEEFTEEGVEIERGETEHTEENELDEGDDGNLEDDDDGVDDIDELE